MYACVWGFVIHFWVDNDVAVNCGRVFHVFYVGGSVRYDARWRKYDVCVCVADKTIYACVYIIRELIVLSTYKSCSCYAYYSVFILKYLTPCLFWIFYTFHRIY